MAAPSPNVTIDGARFTDLLVDPIGEIRRNYGTNPFPTAKETQLISQSVFYFLHIYSSLHEKWKIALNENYLLAAFLPIFLNLKYFFHFEKIFNQFLASGFRIFRVSKEKPAIIFVSFYLKFRWRWWSLHGGFHCRRLPPFRHRQFRNRRRRTDWGPSCNCTQT